MRGQPESLSETLSQMKSTKSIAQCERTDLGCSSEGLVAQLGRAPPDQHAPGWLGQFLNQKETSEQSYFQHIVTLSPLRCWQSYSDNNILGSWQEPFFCEV